ncbi:MAG: ABC transporter ATP-binding protein [Candidatus Geothermarchaeales archaeon]
MGKILEIDNLTRRFGGITAVDECSFSVEDKLILGLIGPNGSGKTTVFNLISGFLRPHGGKIYYKDVEITKLKPHEIARLGIGRTFQLIKLFNNMTVLDNMLAAGLRVYDWEEAVEKSLYFLEFVRLMPLKDELASNLSFGQQRLLEFARALMTDPELILLDEPIAGVNPVMIKEMLNYIRRLNEERGKTFIVISHNMPVIADVCEKVVVLDHGSKIMEGPPSSILKDTRVIDAYLGGAYVE